MKRGRFNQIFVLAKSEYSRLYLCLYLEPHCFSPFVLFTNQFGDKLTVPWYHTGIICMLTKQRYRPSSFFSASGLPSLSRSLRYLFRFLTIRSFLEATRSTHSRSTTKRKIQSSSFEFSIARACKKAKLVSLDSFIVCNYRPKTQDFLEQLFLFFSIWLISSLK